jgi:hypothetical protein
MPRYHLFVNDTLPLSRHPAETLEQILQNSLTEVEAQALNGLALNQEQAEALKAKLPSEFWGGVMRDRIENDPDETLALLNDQNRLFGMDPETRMGLTILAQAEQSRRTGPGCFRNNDGKNCWPWPRQAETTWTLKHVFQP